MFCQCTYISVTLLVNDARLVLTMLCYPICHLAICWRCMSVLLTNTTPSYVWLRLAMLDYLVDYAWLFPMHTFDHPVAIFGYRVLLWIASSTILAYIRLISTTIDYVGGSVRLCFAYIWRALITSAHDRWPCDAMRSTSTNYHWLFLIMAWLLFDYFWLFVTIWLELPLRIIDYLWLFY